MLRLENVSKRFGDRVVLKDVTLMAIEEINAKGGVLGRKIEIVSYDNKSSSADSVRACRSMT